MLPKFSIPLALKKTTPGTHVYANVDQGMTGVYLPKSFFPKGVPAPAEIVMTITESPGSVGNSGIIRVQSKMNDGLE